MRALKGHVTRAELEARLAEERDNTERLVRAVAQAFADGEVQIDSELRRRGLPGLRELGVRHWDPRETRDLHLV